MNLNQEFIDSLTLEQIKKLNKNELDFETCNQIAYRREKLERINKMVWDRASLSDVIQFVQGKKLIPGSESYTYSHKGLGYGIVIEFQDGTKLSVSSTYDPREQEQGPPEFFIFKEVT